MTKKRAPLNAEIIEGLELIRLNYTGKGDEMRAKALEKDIMTIQNYNEPIFDKIEISNITNISEDVKTKIQEYLSKGEIDEPNTILIKKPLWERS